MTTYITRLQCTGSSEAIEYRHIILLKNLNAWVHFQNSKVQRINRAVPQQNSWRLRLRKISDHVPLAQNKGSVPPNFQDHILLNAFALPWRDDQYRRLVITINRSMKTIKLQSTRIKSCIKLCFLAPLLPKHATSEHFPRPLSFTLAWLTYIAYVGNIAAVILVLHVDTNTYLRFMQ